MKGSIKIFGLFLIFALLCLQAPRTAVLAAERMPEFEVRLTADKSTAAAGETVAISVSVENISAAGGLLSVDVPLRFDPAVFEFVSRTAHFPSVWQSPADFSYSQPKSDGLLWLRMLNDTNESFSSSAGCTENGAMSFTVTLKVRVGARSGRSRITADGDGGFEVVSGACADGMCTAAYGRAESLSIEVRGGAPVLGDVTGDGAIDNIDASTVLLYDSGSYELTAEQAASADVNRDGNADNIDSAKILSYDAGLISGF